MPRGERSGRQHPARRSCFGQGHGRSWGQRAIISSTILPDRRFVLVVPASPLTRANPGVILQYGIERNTKLTPGGLCTMNLRFAILNVGAGLLLAAMPVLAHHSFAAEYDADKPIKIQGKVTK